MWGKQTNHKIFAISLILALLTIPLTTMAMASATTQWNLQITNLTGTTINMTLEDLLAMPKTTVKAELACYGNPITNGEWTGVKLFDLLNQAGIDSAATSVDFKASDGYIVSIPMDMALRPNVIVAYDMGGAPLAETLRLVVAGANGNIWIAMITSIQMNTEVLSQGLSGNPNLSSFEQYQSSLNTTTTQPAPTQQPPVQPTPTQLSNPANSGPTVPPVNVTKMQPDQNLSGSVGSGFSFDSVVLVLLGAFASAVVACFAAYRRKRAKV
jgi:DMSO/TMAO reductase YedYZ molybdopterin-dependent catalytic subunit